MREGTHPSAFEGLSVVVRPRRRVDLHHICHAEPHCACVGEESEWDECSCLAEYETVLIMRAIDFETGEEIRG